MISQLSHSINSQACQQLAGRSGLEVPEILAVENNTDSEAER